MKEYNIASIPGDGIGKEVVPEGLKVLKDAAEKHQFKINFTEYDFASCDYYDTIAFLKRCFQSETIFYIHSTEQFSLLCNNQVSWC